MDGINVVRNGLDEHIDHNPTNGSGTMVVVVGGKEVSGRAGTYICAPKISATAVAGDRLQGRKLPA